MTSQEMEYLFRLKADNLDSKAVANIKKPAIVYMLNEGMNNLIKTRYSGTDSVLRKAIEEIQKRRDEFQRLIVPDELLPAVKVNEKLFTSDLTKTKKPYMILLRTNAFATKEQCKKRRMNGIIVSSDNLDLIEDDSMLDSSFEWGEFNFRIAEDKLRMYSDSTFDITNARIDYLRYPSKIDIAGYRHFDGNASTNKDCELPDFLHDDIINEALVVYAFSFTNADLRARLAALSKAE